MKPVKNALRCYEELSKEYENLGYNINNDEAFEVNIKVLIIGLDGVSLTNIVCWANEGISNFLLDISLQNGNLLFSLYKKKY